MADKTYYGVQFYMYYSGIDKTIWFENVKAARAFKDGLELLFKDVRESVKIKFTTQTRQE